jgi:hypothetical protein
VVCDLPLLFLDFRIEFVANASSENHARSEIRGVLSHVFQFCDCGGSGLGSDGIRDP